VAAFADHSSFHATLSGDVAATDNVFATPRETRESDLFLTVRPGILFGYDAPRTAFDATLEGEVLQFVRHSEEPSLSLRTGARAAFQTTKHTSVITQINASNGVLTALSARSTPDLTGPQLTPLGRVDTQQADAGESFSWSSGREYTLSQSLLGRVSRSDGNEDDITMGAIPTITTSAEVGFSLGIDRSVRENAFALDVGASVLHLERDTDPVTAPPGQGPRLDRQFNPRARAQWRHDFGRRYSGTVDAGVVFVRPFGTDPDNPTQEQKNGVFPIVGGALAYSEVWGRAQLSVRRDISPNLFVAQNTVNDTGVVSVAMPLPWLDDSRRRAPNLVGLGSFGINRTQLINANTAKVESAFVVGRLDVGVGYSPRPGFTYGIRYEFVYQTGDDKAVMLIPGYWRNTLSFTFAIRYPDRVAGGEATKRRANSVRADGKDLVPLGVDPISTDSFQDDSGGGEE